MCRVALVALTFALFAGCVTSPYDMQEFSSRTAEMEFHGYGSKPNSKIVLKAYNFKTKQYDEFATTTTDQYSYISTTLGEKVYNLYYWSVKARVSMYMADLNRWEVPGTEKVCPQTKPEGQSTLNCRASLLVSEPDGELQDLWSYPKDGEQCVAKKLGEGEELISASVGCSTRGANLYVNAKE